MQKGVSKVDILSRLKGKDKLETLENYAIALILAGGIILSVGTASTALSTKGIPAILASLGGLIAFASTVALIVIWLIKEFKSG